MRALDRVIWAWERNPPDIPFALAIRAALRILSWLIWQPDTAEGRYWNAVLLQHDPGPLIRPLGAQKPTRPVLPPSPADPLGAAAAELRGILEKYVPEDAGVVDIFLDVGRRRPLPQALRILARAAADVAEHEGATRPELRSALLAFHAKLTGSVEPKACPPRGRNLSVMAADMSSALEGLTGNLADLRRALDRAWLAAEDIAAGPGGPRDGFDHLEEVRSAAARALSAFASAEVEVFSLRRWAGELAAQPTLAAPSEQGAVASGVTLSPADTADLRAQLADLAAAANDAAHPPSRRRLGRATAREQIRESYAKASAILERTEASRACA